MSRKRLTPWAGSFRLAVAVSAGVFGLLPAFASADLVTASRATAEWTTRECKPHDVVDFAGVLNEMRPPAQIPAHEKLPFAPHGIHLSRTVRASVGPTTVGFVAYRQSGNFVGQRGWHVDSKLTLVRKNGAPLRVMGTKKQSLDALMRGKVDALKVGTFHVSSRVAFYRVDFALRRSNSRRHYRYWEYYRVLPMRRDLRLAPSTLSLRVGQTLLWRMENFGTTSVSYGLPYQVDRFDESTDSWAQDPMTPSGFLSIGFELGAGEAGDCQSLKIPAETPAGRYRVVKEAQVGPAEHKFSFEFSVVG